MPHRILRRTRTDGCIPILSVAFDPVRRFSAEPTASGTTPNTGAVIAEKSPAGSNASSSFCQAFFQKQPGTETTLQLAALGEDGCMFESMHSLYVAWQAWTARRAGA